jgi:hypothetical protein
MKLFILIFGGIGALLLLFAGISYFREQRFLETAELTTGTVVDFNLSSSDDGGNAYCPVIDFTTKGGETGRFYSNVCSSPPSYDIGESVEVLYDPEDVGHAQLNSFWSKFTGALVLGCIGLPFLLIGIGVPIWAREPKKKKEK